MRARAPIRIFKNAPASSSPASWRSSSDRRRRSRPCEESFRDARSAEIVLSAPHPRLDLRVIREARGQQSLCRRPPDSLRTFARRPEIYDGIIEIKGTTLGTGSRQEASSASSSIDPVGACSDEGQPSAGVVQELQAQRSHHPWCRDLATFVVTASPATARRFVIDEGESPSRSCPG